MVCIEKTQKVSLMFRWNIQNPKICNPDLLRLVSAALQSANWSKTFDVILDYAKTEQDFVYFDPPIISPVITAFYSAIRLTKMNSGWETYLQN